VTAHNGAGPVQFNVLRTTQFAHAKSCCKHSVFACSLLPIPAEHIKTYIRIY